MKKTTVITLILAMLISCMMPLGISAEGEAQPITNAAEFEAMDPTGSYYLVNDIDFGGKDYTNGYILADFSGTLDGRGHTIYNFSISYTVTSATAITVGIFQTTGAEGATTIKNLKVGKENAEIPVVVNDPMYPDISYNCKSIEIGALAGKQASANYLLTIDNVDVYANVDPASAVFGSSNIGGFVSTSQYCSVTNSTMHGKVVAWNVVKNGASDAAGFIGSMRGNGGVVENCVNFAEVSIRYNVTLRGAGIVGYVNPDNEGCTSLVKSCVNFGKIAANDTKYFTSSGGALYRNVTNALFGGIVGDIQHAGDGTIDSCINFGTVTDVNQSDYSASRSGAGGILGWTSTANVIQNCVNYGRIIAAESTSKADPFIAVDESNGALTLTNNVDKSADVAATPSEDVDTYGVQSSQAANGKFNVRFVASLDTLDYTTVGFEVVAYYRDAQGAYATKEYNVNCTKVYNKIIGKAENGITFEAEASELGGQYVYALSILNVPAVEDNGNVTFVFRAVGDANGTAVYGDTQVASFCAGEFLYCAAVK